MKQDRLVIIGRNLSKHLTTPKVWKIVETYAQRTAYQAVTRMLFAEVCTCIGVILVGYPLEYVLLSVLVVGLGMALVQAGIFLRVSRH